MLKKCFGLLMVLGIGVSFLSCAQLTDVSSTTTTTTSGSEYTAVALAGGNRVVTYGGVRSASAQSVKAQETYTVTGYVYNAEDETPMASAEVWAGTTIVATTDASGAYSLPNVAAGEITFTAIPPTVSSYIGMAVSVTTQAKKIDFYMQKFHSGSYGTVAGQVTDANGNAVADAKVIVQSRLTSNSAFYSQSYNSADGSGNYSYHYASVGKVAVSAGKLGVGNGYSSEETLAENASLEVDIQIPTSQGTITGNFNVPASFSSWQFNQSPVGVLLEPNYLIALPTYESSSSSFNVSVPANTNCVITFGVTTPDYKNITGAMEQNVSAEAGQTVSKNLTLYDVPASANVVTTETYTTLSWEAPSSWTPDFYFVIGVLVHDFSLGTYAYWYAFTDKTAITVPKVMYLSASSNMPLVYAMKTTAAVDLDSVDISNLIPTHYAGIKAEE